MAGRGPGARLFSFLPVARSLANTLLDLGLPAIRAWLRERIPNADVARISTDGPLIHLDGVKLLIGQRGELVLERATAVITPARGRGLALPEVRLHAFRGVLSFTGADQFHADVEFMASPEATEEAWVAGELTIKRATWSLQNARSSAPAHAPMEGRARLVVTSSSWSLDDGALRSEEADVRFAGRGRTEAADGGGAPAGGIETASLVLHGARVSPFLDAVQAMMGQSIEVPPGVPLDARLEGDLAWSASTGGRCTLHITGEGLDARVGAQIEADAKSLSARIEGHVMPAVPMRRAGVPEALLPRAEDPIAFVVEASGDAAHPEVHATFSAPELSFRFGRPRFHPALVGRALHVVVDVARASDAPGATQVAQLRGSLRVSGGTLAIAGDIPLARDAARTFMIRATDLEPLWIAAVAGALAGTPLLRVEEDAPPPAGTFAIPRDARFAGEVFIDLAAAAMANGHVTMTTPRGSLAAQPLVFRGGTLDGTSLRGRVALADTLRMNLFPSDVRPHPHGSLDVDLAVSGPPSSLVLTGTLAAPAIRLSVASRPDVSPFSFENATATLTIDAHSLRLRDLRFAGYKGTFTGHSTIARTPAPAPAPAPALALACRDLDATFVEALASLSRGTLKIRAERESPRPDGELWIPVAARVSGEATLGADLALTTTLALEIPAVSPATSATALSVGFVLGPELRVDGSTIRGALAVAHALTAGAFDTSLRPLPEGRLRIEARLDGPIDDCILTGFITAAHLRLGLHEGTRRTVGSPVFVITDLSTLFRFDTSKLVWHRLAARAYGGTVASSGVIGHAGAFVGLQATVAAREVSLGDLPVDDTGRTLEEMARGRVAVDMRFDRQGGGTVSGRGDLRLEHGTFPVLARSKAALGRYGLLPPAENAIAPATGVIFLHERGWSFTDARAAVPGCEATGRIDIGTDGTLDGALLVMLGEELLASSAVTMLPALLASRLTVPVRITGVASRPQIHAELGAAFGNLVTDNRVSAIFSEAASDVVSLFTRKEPSKPPSSDPPSPPPMDPNPDGVRGDPADEDALIRDLVARGAHWDEIEERLEAHRRTFIRQRIG